MNRWETHNAHLYLKVKIFGVFLFLSKNESIDKNNNLTFSLPSYLFTFLKISVWIHNKTSIVGVWFVAIWTIVLNERLQKNAICKNKEEILKCMYCRGDMLYSGPFLVIF